MTSKRKGQILTLLKGIETGDPAAAAVVNPEQYVQHNPQTHEGSEGLAALFERLSKTSPRVNIVRAFEDGDFVVEHWDNIQQRQGPNPSGHTMVDGPTEVAAPVRTDSNRETVRSFVDEVLIKRRLDRLEHYIDDGRFTEHSPRRTDGLSTLRAALEVTPGEGVDIRYDRVHRVLAEGNFVLSVSEGALRGTHSSLYDLFRVSGGKLVEHWDTTEAIPPRADWKNDNGKF